MPLEYDNDEDDAPRNYKFRRPDSHDEDTDEDDTTCDNASIDFIRCPGCRKYVYEESVRCPRCGHYILDDGTRNRKPLWFIITALVLVFMILSAAVGWDWWRGFLFW